MARLLLICIGVIVILSLVISTVDIYSKINTKACVPFAMKDVPNEQNPEWEFYSVATERFLENGSEFVMRETQYYRHKKYLGLELAVYDYFGQPAFKAWACNAGMDPDTRDKPDYMIAIWTNKDGWVSGYAQSPKRQLIRSDTRMIDGVTITLIERGEKKAETTIYRMGRVK